MLSQLVVADRYQYFEQVSNNFSIPIYKILPADFLEKLREELRLDWDIVTAEFKSSDQTYKLLIILIDYVD